MQSRNDSIQWPETRRKLVGAGVSLMRAKGFHATSLDEICAAADVTKGGFFHYFKSKDEIAKAAIVEFAVETARSFDGASFRKLVDPLQRVLGRLDFVVESANRPVTKGCLVGMLAQELSFTNSELRKVCLEAFSGMAQDFEKDLVEAKAMHAPKAAFDVRKLATLYVTIVEGSLILAKAAESNATLLQNMEHFRHYIELLFGGASKSGNKRAKQPSSACS